MRILRMDCSFSLVGSESFGFSSSVSVFDYDVVVWDPQGTEKHYDALTSTMFRGRPSLGESSSAKFVDDLRRRRKEFREFVALGRMLVVIAREPYVFWVLTGDQETSGTGRNQKVTNIVKELDLLSALPFEYSSRPGSGLEIEPVSDLVSSLWRETKGYWAYRCILDEFPGRPLFRVAGVDMVVGSALLEKDGGAIVILPDPWIPDEEEDEALDSNPEADDQDVDVEDALLRFIQSLAIEDTDALPSWSDELQFPEQADRDKEMAEIEKQIGELTERLDTLKAVEAAQSQWKQLIAGQGAGLERQVSAAFSALGFEVLDVLRGRSDIRLAYEGQLVVVEVKGVAKTAAEKHAAQLEKWVAEEAAEGTSAKGVLVVNGWRETRLGSRAEVFPDQMLGYSIARGHCLLTGLQLLVMCERARRGTEDPETLAKRILSTSGVMEDYSDPGEVFKLRPETAEATP